MKHRNIIFTMVILSLLIAMDHRGRSNAQSTEAIVVLRNFPKEATQEAVNQLKPILEKSLTRSISITVQSFDPGMTDIPVVTIKGGDGKGMGTATYAVGGADTNHTQGAFIIARSDITTKQAFEILSFYIFDANGHLEARKEYRVFKK